MADNVDTCGRCGAERCELFYHFDAMRGERALVCTARAGFLAATHGYTDAVLVVSGAHGVKRTEHNYCWNPDCEREITGDAAPGVRVTVGGREGSLCAHCLWRIDAATLSPPRCMAAHNADTNHEHVLVLPPHWRGYDALDGPAVCGIHCDPPAAVAHRTLPVSAWHSFRVPRDTDLYTVFGNDGLAEDFARLQTALTGAFSEVLDRRTAEIVHGAVGAMLLYG